jgi:hypothetical protein
MQGHDGVVEGSKILNDVTVMQLQKQAVMQARAGAHIVAPSGNVPIASVNDSASRMWCCCVVAAVLSASGGVVQFLRRGLSAAGEFCDVPLCVCYTVKS